MNINKHKKLTTNDKAMRGKSTQSRRPLRQLFLLVSTLMNTATASLPPSILRSINGTYKPQGASSQSDDGTSEVIYLMKRSESNELSSQGAQSTPQAPNDIIREAMMGYSHFQHAMAFFRRIDLEVESSTTETGSGLVDRRTDNNITIAEQPIPAQIFDISELYEDKYKGTDPSQAWIDTGTARPWEYWNKNPTTEEAAGSIGFFASWIDNYNAVDSHKCKEKGMSAMSCFAWEFWGDEKYNCQVSKTEACHQPAIKQILEHIDGTWSQYDVTKRVDLARKVMFATRNFHTIIWEMSNLHLTLGFVKQEVVERLPQIIKDFSPTRDKMQIAKCEITKMVIKIVIDLIMEAVAAAAAYGGGPLLSKLTRLGTAEGAVGAIVKVGKWLKDKENEKWISAHIKQVATIIKSGIAQGRNVKAIHEKLVKARGSTDKTTSTGLGDMPALEMHLTKAKGLCGNAFSIPEDDTAKNTENAIKFIQEYLEVTQEAVETQFRSLIAFNDGVDPELLTNLMRAESMKVSDDEGLFYSDRKRKLQKTVENLLVAKTLSGSRCFMACETNHHSARFLCQEDQRSATENTKQSRFCPADRDDVRCELACMSKQEKYERKKFLYGMPDLLKRYDITPQKIQDASWEFYQNQGTIGSMYTDHAFVNGTIEGADSMLHLPVCMSKVHTIEDISSKKRRSKFPWSCGGYMSEESAPFLEATNVHLEHEKELVRWNIPKHLFLIPEPLNQYALLCNLNVRWPNHLRLNHYNDITQKWEKDAKNTLRANSRDPDCNAVFDLVEGLDEKEANVMFCTSELGAKIIRRQKIDLVNPSMHGLKVRCKEYMWANGGYGGSLLSHHPRMAQAEADIEIVHMDDAAGARVEDEDEGDWVE